MMPRKKKIVKPVFFPYHPPANMTKRFPAHLLGLVYAVNPLKVVFGLIFACLYPTLYGASLGPGFHRNLDSAR